jgi:hypothetical protein
MAIQWADDFTRYGLGNSALRMLDGLPYASFGGTGTQVVVNDPDPNNPEGRAFQVPAVPVTNRWREDCRIALPIPTTQKVGVAFRMWLTQLAAVPQARQEVLAFRSTSDNLASFRVEQNGSITGLGESGATLADTVVPVVSPQSWNHMEFIYDTATGEAELFINGIPRLTWTNDTSGQTVALLNFSPRTSGAGSSGSLLIKDLVIWDGSGTENNSVMGTVIVRRLKPNEDDDLGGWDKVLPTYNDAHRILSSGIPFNTLTIVTNSPSTTLNIQAGSMFYRYTTGSVDAGTPDGTSTNPWLIQRLGTNTENAENFLLAVNAAGTAGTTYSTALTANAEIAGVNRSSNVVTVTARDGETTAYPFAGYANVNWLETSEMRIRQNQPDDLSYMTADDSPPAPMKFGFENLPDDTTSVRGVISVIRHRKIDGGDANVQVSLSPNDIDWALGDDRPITSAFQYDFDVQELNPETNAAWTPVSVNNLLARVDRTV